MRFRLVNNGQASIWVLLSLFWVGLTAEQLHHDLIRHRNIEEHVVMMACWILICLLYVYMYLFSHLEFEPTALKLRIAFHSIWVPYNNIVAARSVYTSKGKLVPNQIELETARLSPAIYPHAYRRLAVSDTASFLRALHDKVPQAEFETA